MIGKVNIGDQYYRMQLITRNLQLVAQTRSIGFLTSIFYWLVFPIISGYVDPVEVTSWQIVVDFQNYLVVGHDGVVSIAAQVDFPLLLLFLFYLLMLFLLPL